MKLKDLIYPPRCPFCETIQKDATPCKQCLKNTTELTAIVCPTCGAYPEDCHCGLRQFAFRRNVSAFAYAGAPRNLLLRYKQRNRPQLAEFMSRRMYFHIIARLGTDFSCITYVPQTRQSSIKRGYYPSKVLAEHLAQRLNLPCCDVLRRVGGTQQKYLSSEERWENAKENYALLPKASVSGRVQLIDDLFTTGATLNACADLLRSAGADEVVCATFANAVKKS
ncbi:MAG: ComF family protein [Clostridia bacterium]|nr:ComF family protein [Clostridia bacterium]